jgi:retron-type reverse transcriptase
VIIERIANLTGLDPAYLNKVAVSASHRYKVYTIPKRIGGVRIIHHPSKELKFIQRWLADNLFSFLPVHDSVYSYRKGISIKDLARAHKEKNYLLRVDFTNFFPSIQGPDAVKLLRRNASRLPFPLSMHDLQIIRSIVCKDDRLTIGAPSSPVLSNAILFEFDSYWSDRCRELSVVYSRYADDLYFSTTEPNLMGVLLIELKKDIKRRKSPRLSLADEKTVYTSRKHKRLVTGLVLTSDKKVSIGRAKKRYIKSMVYRFMNKQLRDVEVSYLRGYIAYVNAVEPSFIDLLERKYGKECITALRQSPTVSNKPII